MLALNSKDETGEETELSKPNLKIPHRFEMYSEMIYGWLAARGDLADEKVRLDFQKGCEQVLQWFAEHV